MIYIFLMLLHNVYSIKRYYFILLKWIQYTIHIVLILFSDESRKCGFATNVESQFSLVSQAKIRGDMC